MLTGVPLEDISQVGRTCREHQFVGEEGAPLGRESYIREGLLSGERKGVRECNQQTPPVARKEGKT